MTVRIRFGHGPRPRLHSQMPRRVALALASLLTPSALMAWALAGWRLAADLDLTGDFVVSTGLFSHWQVWGALALAIQLTGATLNRFGRGGPVAR